MFKGLFPIMGGVLMLFAALPAGTSYKLQSYGVGSGGTANSTSSSYAMEGISGETGGTQMAGTSYKTGAGFISTEQANVPAAPTFTNPSNYYNKLKIVLDTGSNPSDTKFVVAISTDNFTTTQYVKSDFTVGSSLTITDYQTYASWGSGSGVNIVGLIANTTYKVKVKAMQGKFTETGYGPIATAATVNPSLTFDLDVSASDTETGPPYNLTFTDLLAGTVVNSNQKIWVDFDTNADSGGNVYVYGLNNGLLSLAVSYTITTVTGDLSALSLGYGAQSASATQSSGGPFTAVSPYNGATNNVGLTDTNIRKLYTSTAPITAGRSSVQLKAKAAATTPSAADYRDVLTFVGAASY